MKEGLVRWFNDKMGYGFIECPSDKRDYFVHRQGIASMIYRDQEVVFDTIDVVDRNTKEGKRKIAINVRPKE